jgi:hypothetical protein
MSDATLKNALRELQDDLERFHADLENEIASIVDFDDIDEDDILVKGDDGVTRLSVAELRSLLERHDEAAAEVASAFQDFDEEVDRAWRRFRKALTHREINFEMGATS